jgi:hypothetical protein
MSRSIVVRWFFGSLIGLAGGVVLLVVAGAVALANDVFIMRGPDVVGIRSGALSWTLAGLVALALLVMMASAVAVFVAWIGAVLNTAGLPSKTWCVVLLVVGVLGLPFLAALAYVIAGPDGTKADWPDASAAGSPTAGTGSHAVETTRSEAPAASSGRRG